MRRWQWLALAVFCFSAFAEEPSVQEQKTGPTLLNQQEPEPVASWGTGDGKSWWIPAGNIVLFDSLLNLFARNYVEPKADYRSTLNSIRENVGGPWAFDNDTFSINQFGHPYQGSMYHGFARAAGQGYWTSLGYTFAASALWEYAGETTQPSINDQFTTGIGGTFLGEPLFRIASLLLESGDGAAPSRLRTFAASLVSPATGATRWAYGDRFDGVFQSHDPAVYTRAQLGANINASLHSDVNTNPDPATPAIPQEYERGEALADFTMLYGLPGKPGYTYARPFDYFHFELITATGNAVESLMTRGLLLGSAVGAGESYRGIWGLYGSYDYIAPQIFRVSNTALGLGTTGQWWLSRGTALQHDLGAGVGYGSGGVIHGNGLRDYHYGITPQALTALRLIFGDRLAIELAARDYWISDRASAEDGTENIARAEIGATLRLRGLHGITVKYTVSRRDARYERLPDTSQTVAAVSIGYTWIGHRWFGAVDWREKEVQSASD